MVFHNNPEAFRAYEPHDERIYNSQFTYEQYPPHVNNGLFYRKDILLDRAELEANLLHPNGEATIRDYQYWTEMGWKEEHGSYAAVKRFGDKLKEETAELSEAIHELQTDSSKSDEVKQELGDVLWCTTALACGVASDVDAGLKNKLFRYVSGVQHFEDQRSVEPTWRPTASRLAVKYEPLSLADIDELIKSGFEPLLSPVMNIFDPDGDEFEISQHFNSLLAYAINLLNGAKLQYGRDPDDEDSDTTGILPSYFNDQARQAGEVVAQIYLELAFLAHRTIGATFTDIVRTNVSKLSYRIDNSMVDKTDNPRS